MLNQPLNGLEHIGLDAHFLRQTHGRTNFGKTPVKHHKHIGAMLRKQISEGKMRDNGAFEET